MAHIFRRALTVLGSTALLATAAPAMAEPPTIPDADAASAMLAELTVEPDGPQDGYDRDKFPHWSDQGDSCKPAEPSEFAVAAGESRISVGESRISVGESRVSVGESRAWDGELPAAAHVWVTETGASSRLLGAPAGDGAPPRIPSCFPGAARVTIPRTNSRSGAGGHPHRHLARDRTGVAGARHRPSK